jgi:arylsulfatase A-like enzyme
MNVEERSQPAHPRTAPERGRSLARSTRVRQKTLGFSNDLLAFHALRPGTDRAPAGAVCGRAQLQLPRVSSFILHLSSFALVALVAFLATATALAEKPPSRPNIVFILADDLGYTDVACYGSKYYETPNIDRLAAHGMRFTSGYTCGPNCQPTRATLMSGQYGPRTGVYTVGSIERFNWRSRPLRPADNVVGLSPAKITIAESLKQAGYATALFGKWHLGEDPKHHPLAQGFDEAIVSMGVHFDFRTNPKTNYPDGTYLADFLTDKAADFIRRHKDGPFYLSLHHFAVHVPLQAKTNLIERFKSKPAAGGHHNPVYAAMLASVDESVGRIVALLDELKIADNTLVIFTSDNGGVGGYEREGVQGGSITDNAPLKGGKGMLYEGGIRVPYIFRWPGKIPAKKTCDKPINSVDLYPTLLELAGAEAPSSYPLDGRSYLNLLTKANALAQRGYFDQFEAHIEERSWQGSKPLFWHFPGYLGAKEGMWRTTPAGAIRVGDWKLLEFFEDDRLELYNLRKDIGEMDNLAAAHPKIVKGLHDRLVAWRKEIKAPMPTPNLNIEKPSAETDASPTKKGKRGGKAKSKTPNPKPE